MAEIQGYNLANDWIEVEYKGDHIFRIEVLKALGNNKLKMRGSLF